MPVRRLFALVTGLPDDAAVWRPDRRSWTNAEELAALNVEMLDQVGWLIAYWLQVVASPSYRGLRAEMPEPLLGRIEHPGGLRSRSTPRRLTGRTRRP